jgi:hypothetical protein
MNEAGAQGDGFGRQIDLVRRSGGQAWRPVVAVMSVEEFERLKALVDTGASSTEKKTTHSKQDHRSVRSPWIIAAIKSS